MSEAEKLCDRIAILHSGSIVANDTLANLRTATGRHYLEDVFLALVGDERHRTNTVDRSSLGS
jgi:ABC-type Na+ transport system ATPase subunit NatA